MKRPKYVKIIAWFGIIGIALSALLPVLSAI